MQARSFLPEAEEPKYSIKHESHPWHHIYLLAIEEWWDRYVVKGESPPLSRKNIKILSIRNRTNQSFVDFTGILK